MSKLNPTEGERENRKGSKIYKKKKQLMVRKEKDNICPKGVKGRGKV